MTAEQLAHAMRQAAECVERCEVPSTCCNHQWEPDRFLVGANSRFEHCKRCQAVRLREIQLAEGTPSLPGRELFECWKDRIMPLLGSVGDELKRLQSEQPDVYAHYQRYAERNRSFRAAKNPFSPEKKMSEWNDETGFLQYLFYGPYFNADGQVTQYLRRFAPETKRKLF